MLVGSSDQEKGADRFSLIRTSVNGCSCPTFHRRSNLLQRLTSLFSFCISTYRQPSLIPAPFPSLQYWRSLPFSRDSKRLRLAIVAVLLLLTWACIMCVIDIWQWGVSQNRSAQGLEATSVMDAMTPLPAMLVGVLVQSVFVTRALSVSLALPQR